MSPSHTHAARVVESGHNWKSTAFGNEGNEVTRAFNFNDRREKEMPFLNFKEVSVRPKTHPVPLDHGAVGAVLCEDGVTASEILVVRDAPAERSHALLQELLRSTQLLLRNWAQHLDPFLVVLNQVYRVQRVCARPKRRQEQQLLVIAGEIEFVRDASENFRVTTLNGPTMCYASC